MRIISGKYKGRQLVEFSAEHIRPTTDRVKETLFNKLMSHIEGARVLDLFSGTGNLAIECLSRGAALVDLVENHGKSIRIIRENLKLLKIEAGYKIHSCDAFGFIQTYAGPGYDLVLADPPFTRSWAHDLCCKIGVSQLLTSEGVFVIESSAKERMDESYPGLIRLDVRRFGDKHLTFYQHLSGREGEGPRHD